MILHDTVLAAINIAIAAHHHQTDKSGQPYIGHPARVAARCTTGHTRAAAWLHDVLEDTAWTADDLTHRGIPDPVVATVQALTHQPDEPEDDYLTRIVAAGPEAVTVKWADMSDNSDPARLEALPKADAARLRRKYDRRLGKLWDWTDGQIGA